MGNYVYELIGLFLLQKKEKPRIWVPGIHICLDFIVEDKTGFPALVKTDPVPKSYSNGVILRGSLQENSHNKAITLMGQKNYRKIPGEIPINLNTQVIC